jgi:hypothetical protein
MNSKAILFAGTALVSVFQGTAISALINGDFATGNLDGWSVFLTSNGNLGSAYGLPDVVSFDVTGTGVASSAARFQVGEAAYDPFTGHTFQGGGLLQTFNAVGGNYLISADIAGQDASSFYNWTAGRFSLLVDGSSLAIVDFRQLNGGDVAPGQILRSSLTATLVLSPGAHELRLEMTRDVLNGSSFAETPLQYLDNVKVTLVPEPSALVLVVVGLAGTAMIWARRTSRLPTANAVNLP